MKKTNLIGMAFSLMFVFVLCNATVFAQSTDPDNPTSLTKNEIQGKNLSDKIVSYYYTFTAGPGILKVTADVKTNIYSKNLNWQLSDANSNELASDSFNGGTAGKRSGKEINLTKKQKLILKVNIAEGVADFKFQFAGAVNFAAANTNENVREITGDNTGDNTESQQICMPRNGVLIMTMKDGKKAKIDLSKVQKIEVQ